MRKLLKSATAVLVTLIIIISTMTIPVSAAGQTTIKLKQGNNLSYGSGYGWTTHMLYADDTMTYCINPHKPLPADGVYSTDKNNLYEYTQNMPNYNLFRKALYYCYGGEGFRNTSYFPTDTSKHKPL